MVTSCKFKSNSKDSPFETITAVWKQHRLKWTANSLLYSPFCYCRVRHISLGCILANQRVRMNGPISKGVSSALAGPSPDDPPSWKSSRSWPWGRGCALGRTKLSNALGQQYLELSACTWSGSATWNRGKFVYQSAIEVGQRSSLEKTLILQQENWFIIRQRHIRITKGKFEHSSATSTWVLLCKFENK